MLWYGIPKQHSHTKINQQAKTSLYNWILQHPHVVVSRIKNHCLKLFVEIQLEPQLALKLLVCVSVIELHNIMVISPEEGVIKEARDADNNIIISDSTLRNFLPPILKNMSSQCKVMCGYECFLSSKNINSFPLTWHDHHMKHLKDRIQDAQNRRSGEIPSRIFETYKNTVRPHGCHIYNTAADMTMATICPCTY